jgi:flagellar hook-associated protein 2
MGRITSGIGLVSGINSANIIDQLMSLEARPKKLVQQRLDVANQQKLAYTDLATRLTSLRVSAQTLKKVAAFQNRSANSTNPDVLTASVASGAAKGSYQFQVARLVTAQQAVTAGFANADTQKVGAGTITIEMGGGEIHSQTPLAALNGGQGVRSGSFRITDRSGRSGVIDISGALTLDDVVRRINTNLDITVHAAITGNGLTLTDQTGQTLSDLIVVDLGGGHAAQDLGIAASSSSQQLVGQTINYVGRATRLGDLNDGRGVRAIGGLADFRIVAADGSAYDIDVSGLTTVGAVLDAINAATGGAVVASISPGQRGLRLTDHSGGSGTFQVVALNGSRAAADLGIEKSSATSQIEGSAILASLNSVLLSSLRGGEGLNLGQISITDRAGAQATVDLSAATTVREVLDLINGSAAAVTARISTAGNSIELVDVSGGSGNLFIQDVDSTTAAELGIAGTFDSAVPVVRGANLQRQWVNENTLLSSYNGGRGVTAGKFRITNSLGTRFDIDLSNGAARTIGDVINQINTKVAGVVASINANGDGLLLTDTAGGATLMKVEDVTGRAAADLNIAGTASDLRIDGSFEKTIEVSDTDTLSSVMTAINNLGFGASATIINDGSGSTPLRLSLTARNTGLAGRFIFDAGNTALAAANLVEAQDAAVFYGTAGAERPLVITSSTNQLKDVVRGVTLELHGVSTSPVTVNISDSVDQVVAELNKFTDNFNALVGRIKELTAFDSESNTRGLLMGDAAIQQVQSELYRMVQSTVSGAGSLRRLSDVGLRIGQGAVLEFDEDRFRSAYASDPEAVKRLFTLYETGGGSVQQGFGPLLEERINRLIDPVSGLITQQNRTLDQRTTQFQDRITQLDKLLANKRTRLEKQFASLESVLAGLQSQQQALASFTPLKWQN